MLERPHNRWRLVVGRYHDALGPRTALLDHVEQRQAVQVRHEHIDERCVEVRCAYKIGDSTRIGCQHYVGVSRALEHAAHGAQEVLLIIHNQDSGHGAPPG